MAGGSWAQKWVDAGWQLYLDGYGLGELGFVCSSWFPHLTTVHRSAGISLHIAESCSPLPHLPTLSHRLAVCSAPLPEKSESQITGEIQAIIRQITASVTFLPLLQDTCEAGGEPALRT